MSLLSDAVLSQGAPTHPALVVTRGGPSLTYAQLQDQVEAAGRYLLAVGCGRGHVVSLALRNDVECVASFLGATWAGCVAAPLNPDYKRPEFEFFLRDAQTRLLIVPEAGHREAEAAARTLGIPVHTVRCTKTTGELSYRHLRGGKQPPSVRGQVDGEDVALLLHTSGTTSKPKAVPLTHANLVASLHNIKDTYRLSPTDVSLCVMPLFHVHGLMSSLFAGLLGGGSVVLQKEKRFSASFFWRDAKETGATWTSAVPTILQILLSRAAQDYNGHVFRFIRSCSAALPAPILGRLETQFKAPVLEAYAMTEASHQMTSNPLPSSGRPHKPGSVGVPHGGVEVCVLDSKGRTCRPNEIGEICVRGQNVTKGYLNVSPHVLAEAYGFGWFHTGDQGMMDEDGYVVLTGRLKELINRGGEKISPLEIDSVLLEHPLITEAVTFGLPDAKYGEEVAAAVVVRDSRILPKDVTRFCEKRLSAFKVPKRVFVVSAIPKGPTGKIQRRALSELYAKQSRL